MNINPIPPHLQPLIKFRYNHSIQAWQMYGYMVGDITKNRRWIAVKDFVVKEFIDKDRADIVVEETVSA